MISALHVLLELLVQTFIKVNKQDGGINEERTHANIQNNHTPHYMIHRTNTNSDLHFLQTGEFMPRSDKTDKKEFLFRNFFLR